LPQPYSPYVLEEVFSEVHGSKRPTRRSSRHPTKVLENALRHTPPGGKVELRVGPGERPATLQATVRDTGPGIPAEHLPNVFEHFYRADRARSRSAGGSGIGLAVVKQLVEAHGGRVWAESPPGRGATFGLELPATPTGPRSNGLPGGHEKESQNGQA
jgi:signal transduction histidine kinase